MWRKRHRSQFRHVDLYWQVLFLNLKTHNGNQKTQITNPLTCDLCWQSKDSNIEHTIRFKARIPVHQGWSAVLDNILMILLFLEPLQQWGQSVKFVKAMGPQQNIHSKTLGNVWTTLFFSFGQRLKWWLRGNFDLKAALDKHLGLKKCSLSHVSGKAGYTTNITHETHKW